jgi:hypothetical protein
MFKSNDPKSIISVLNYLHLRFSSAVTLYPLVPKEILNRGFTVYISDAGFEVFTAVVMKSLIFWDVMACSLLSCNRRFGGTYRLHLQGRRNKFSKKKPASKQVAPHGGHMFLRNVGWHSTDYTASYPRRWYTVKPLFIVFVGGLKKKRWIRENNRWGRNSLNRIRSGSTEIEWRIRENELSGNDR